MRILQIEFNGKEQLLQENSVMSPTYLAAGQSQIPAACSVSLLNFNMKLN